MAFATVTHEKFDSTVERLSYRARKRLAYQTRHPESGSLQVKRRTSTFYSRILTVAMINILLLYGSDVISETAIAFYQERARYP
jgi:tRNA(Ile2) C34 agmatinyltransferase TiaS